VDKLGSLHHNDPRLTWNFKNSVFPTITVNFGPQTVCYDHLDVMNKAAGWCHITAMGQYDHTKGGHLVLFDIGRIIEFPPGSHILIPSAVMRHANTALQPGETRVGLTQYAAGALFRWVDSGFCKSERATSEVRARMATEAPIRFETLLNLYSKPDGLAHDRAKISGKK
jgi:hypothetical protein